MAELLGKNHLEEADRELSSGRLGPDHMLEAEELGKKPEKNPLEEADEALKPTGPKRNHLSEAQDALGTKPIEKALRTSSSEDPLDEAEHLGKPENKVPRTAKKRKEPE